MNCRDGTLSGGTTFAGRFRCAGLAEAVSPPPGCGAAGGKPATSAAS